MIIDLVTVLGLVAATFTTIAFIPQVIKTARTKSTKDISKGMFTLMSSASFLWLIYGFLIGSLPVIIANVALLILSTMILSYKLKYT